MAEVSPAGPEPMIITSLTPSERLLSVDLDVDKLNSIMCYPHFIELFRYLTFDTLLQTKRLDKSYFEEPHYKPSIFKGTVGRMQELIGTNLGPYNIIKQIGVGGMATIFKAHQTSLNRDVALKVLPPHLAKNADFTERFKRESQAIGSLHHPNILPVYDSGQDKGYSYLVMRYVPNAVTLGDLMKQSLETEQVKRIISQIAAALDHAHQAGIIHRDVKPSNALLDKRWVLLSDFGLAKMVGSSSKLTATGAGMGTPAYMSPEQGMGEKVDHRTDIYSLGIILYEMLTGQVPHQAETPIATVMKRLNEALPSPRSLNPDISAAVERVLLKALAFDPANRYDNAGEMAEALQNAFNAPSMPASVTHNKIEDGVAQPDPTRVSKSPPAPVVTDAPDAAPLQAPFSRSRSAFEITVLVILGLFSICSIITFPFLAASSVGIDFAGISLGLGMLATSASAMAMIWFRNRSRSVSGKLKISILLWFIGAMIVTMGGFTVFTPGSSMSFWQNLGFSTTFCLAPGSLIALAGAALYFREYRQSQQAETRARMAAFDAVEAIQSRAGKLKRAEEYVDHVDKFIKNNKSRLYIEQMTPLSQKLRMWKKNLNIRPT
ncbi:MAG: hypothetical protein B6243_09185 [Anaerolineaceae bacterium 4572_5.2]|nr:MAG: hypothetical protein B6243_09185 [Anaerolineaceae bacterium 4572_5.2]